MPLSPTTARKYGLTPLPADQAKTPPATSSPSTVKVSDIPIPSTPLAQRINSYVKGELDADTYRHCLRVYSYGVAIARECFPDWNLGVAADAEGEEEEEGKRLDETWFVCALLHDLGTTQKNMASTRLSYEFWAGIKALEVLMDKSSTCVETARAHAYAYAGTQTGACAEQGKDGVVAGQAKGEDVAGVGKEAEADSEAPLEQAESVAEAIFRHQDIQTRGNISLLTRLIHLGTLLDNIGVGAELVSKGTIEEVNGKYSREGWSGCFSKVVQREKREKAYAMVSRIEGFEGLIEGNEVTDI